MSITVDLDSTALRRATYNPDTQVLDLTMTSGQTYSYEGVPQDIFEGLRDAYSPGQYFHQNIKGAYGNG